MNPEQVRSLLDQERARLLQAVGDLDRSFIDIVEAAQGSNGDDEHDVEGDTVAVARAHIDALLQANRQRLLAIEEALDRIARGEYGACQGCGAEIPVARLEARPSTPWCLACARVRGP